MAGARRLIVALDFDGTLLTHNWPNLGKDIGAFEWLLQFQKEYSELKYMLWTVRSDGPLVEAAEYCADVGLKLWSVNVNLDQHTWPVPGSCKAHAHIYVDDAAMGAPLIFLHGDPRPHVDWERMGPMLAASIEAYHMAELRRG